MAEVYILGEGYEVFENGQRWPYRLELIMDEREKRFCMSEGSGHGAAGGCFTAAELLDHKWAKNIERTKTQWLLPILKRIEQGNIVSNDDILFEFQKSRNSVAKKSHWTAN